MCTHAGGRKRRPSGRTSHRLTPCCNAPWGAATYAVMSSEPDASVLRRSIDQPDCFALLFDRHFAQVHRYLRRRLGDELAAELAAETFLRAFRSRGRFSGEEASVLAWLYGIAANLVRMNHRTEERRLRAYARAASGVSAYDPAIAVEDRLDAEGAHRCARAAERLGDLVVRELGPGVQHEHLTQGRGEAAQRQRQRRPERPAPRARARSRPSLVTTAQAIRRNTRIVANWAASIRLPLAAEGRQPDDGGVSAGMTQRTPRTSDQGVPIRGLGVAIRERSAYSWPSRRPMV